MIAFIRGYIVSLEDDLLIIDNNGLGYAVLIPRRRLNQNLAIGEEIMLHTHLQIREDAWQLFGFGEYDQLKLFRQLLAVSGIGAKTALAIVDNLSVNDISVALSAGDYNLFCKVPGVGKKTAQRLVVDLKDKFSFNSQLALDQEQIGAGIGAMALNNDDLLLQALGQLGYKGAEARALAIAARNNLGADAKANQLLQEAMRLAAQN